MRIPTTVSLLRPFLSNHFNLSTEIGYHYIYICMMLQHSRQHQISQRISKHFVFLSSPVSKHLIPKPPRPNPNQDPLDLNQKGLGLTLKCCRPPPPTPNFKHERGVQQQNSMSKNILEWSPLLVQPNKFQVDSERKDMV